MAGESWTDKDESALALLRRKHVGIVSGFQPPRGHERAREPGGDSEGGAEVLERFRRLYADGQMIVLVTHDQSVAGAPQRDVCTRDCRVDDDSGRDTLSESVVVTAESDGSMATTG